MQLRTAEKALKELRKEVQEGKDSCLFGPEDRDPQTRELVANMDGYGVAFLPS